MLLSLVDSLRCPAHAEEAPLVLSVETWAGPRVAEGVLGCPMCHARYAIHRGTVDFTGGGARVRHTETSECDGLRLAAQLGLTESGGIVLLTGRYASLHEALASAADVVVILLDAVETTSARSVNFDLQDRLPLNDRTLRGAAVDESRNGISFLAEVVRCLRASGRLVVPALTDLPAGVRIIARDDREWVGEVGNFTLPVRLGRSPKP